MTVTSTEIFIYITALIILFITPGPVWIAIIARTISGGAKSGLSLVSGVCLGDMLWPIVVFLGIGFLLSIYSDFLINKGNASASDIENLGKSIVEKVYSKFNVKLEWEVKIIGE